MPLSKIDFHESFIKPLREFGGWTYTEPQMDFLFKELCNEGVDTLAEASQKIVRECIRKPYMGEIIKAVAASRDYSYSAGQQSTYVTPPNHTPMANAWLRTPLGQKALQEGWGFMAWDTIKETGNDQFSESEIKNMTIAAVRYSIDLGRWEENKPDTEFYIGDPHLQRACIGLLKAPIEKNEDLKRRYAA